MSILHLRARPWVVFDVDNSLHRKYYFDFLKNKTWSTCPVRFTAADGIFDLVGMINGQLAAHYVKNEFNGNT